MNKRFDKSAAINRLGRILSFKTVSRRENPATIVFALLSLRRRTDSRQKALVPEEASRAFLRLRFETGTPPTSEQPG
jgi:hypothetical protein